MKHILILFFTLISLLVSAQTAPTNVATLRSKVSGSDTTAYIPFSGGYLGGLRFNQNIAKWQFTEDGGTTWKRLSSSVFPSQTGNSGKYLTTDGTNVSWATVTAGVSSVTGTTNRITVTGTSTPVVDISSSYIGQSSITTLGTIGTGVWQGTAIGDSYISSSSTWNSKESALTFSAPLSRSTNTISIPVATNSIDGYLSAADRTTFNNKQSTLVSGTNIKTVGSTSLLGSGDIPFPTTITGNAGTATALQTAQTIGITTGDVVSSGSLFDGTANNTNSLTVTKINGTSLAGLTTGILKNTTTTGVPSIAISGTDYQSPITFGTGVQTALGVNIGNAGAPILFNGAAGTPSSLTGTNITGMPVTGLAAGSAIALDQIRRNSGNTAWETYTPITNPYTTIGDLVQGTDNIGGIGRLAAGTSGLPLKSNGAGTLVSYGQIGDAAISDLAYSKLTGTVPFYSKALGGTATAANTFDFSGISWLNLTGTFTTTANNQTMVNFGGSHTLRGTASDYFASYTINPTITMGANTQTISALHIEPLPNAGSFTSPVMTGIMIRYNSSTAATQLTNAIQIQDQNAGPLNRLRITTAGSIMLGTSSVNRIRGAGTNNGNIILESDFGNSTAVDVPSIGFQAGGTFGGSTGHRILLGTASTANTFAGTGSSSYTYWYGGQVITGTASGNISGFVWDPTYTSYTGTGIHYGFRAFEASSLNGFGISSPTSTLSSGGSFSTAYSSKTANYTLTSLDEFIDCTSNSFTTTLPTAVGIQGRVYTIKNSGTSTTITLATTSSQTIDGVSPGVLYSGESIQVKSDNANWKIISLKTNKEIRSTISTYTNYITTATYQNITSITLDPGDWDLSAFFTYSANSATITSSANAIFTISTTTASASGATEGLNISYIPHAALLGTSFFSDAIPPYLVSPSSTTTYYLNSQDTFTLGNSQYVGTLRARKIR